METRLTSSVASTPYRSPFIKHSVMLVGQKTSVSLEDQFWDGLHQIALNKGVSTTALIERIDINRTVHNLSSAIRLFVLDYFKNGGSQQIFQNASPDRTAK
jgi:predicted DNA-binding ribbon-helix-helix protein